MTDLKKYEGTFSANTRTAVKKLEQIDQNDLETYQRLLHNLKSNAAIFGCQGLAKLASLMEEIFARAIKNDLQLSPSLLKKLHQSCAQILEKSTDFESLQKASFQPSIENLKKLLFKKL